MSLLSITQIVRKTNLTRTSVLNILKNPKYSALIEFSSKGDDITGVNLTSLLKVVKSKEFRTEFGFVDSTELQEKAKQEGYDFGNPGSFRKTVSSLAKKGKLDFINVTEDEGASKIFRLYKANSVMKQLENELSRRLKAKTSATRIPTNNQDTASIATPVYSTNEGTSKLDEDVSKLNSQIAALEFAVDGLGKRNSDLQDEIRKLRLLSDIPTAIAFIYGLRESGKIPTDHITPNEFIVNIYNWLVELGPEEIYLTAEESNFLFKLVRKYGKITF